MIATAFLIVGVSVLAGTAWGFWCGWKAAKSQPFRHEEIADCEMCAWAWRNFPGPTGDGKAWCYMFRDPRRFCGKFEMATCGYTKPNAAGEVRRNAVTSTGLLAVSESGDK
jgi:hypothetical protein